MNIEDVFLRHILWEKLCPTPSTSTGSAQSVANSSSHQTAQVSSSEPVRKDMVLSS